MRKWLKVAPEMLYRWPESGHGWPLVAQGGCEIGDGASTSGWLMKTKGLAAILLAVFLILFGILTSPTLGVHFNYSADILAVLAIVTGVVVLLRRFR